MFHEILYKYRGMKDVAWKKRVECAEVKFASLFCEQLD